MNSIPQYEYADADPRSAHECLWPALQQFLSSRFSSSGEKLRAFDLGCGSGATCNLLAQLDFETVGVDVSESGIAQARSAYPDCRFEIASAYDDLEAQFGRFDVVISLEVVEHLYAPREFAKTIYSLLKPGGVCVISTPYHGYLKNVALAVTGKMDRHFTALWDGGHIKFWSFETMRQLLSEAGFEDLSFARVGRIPPLARSMIATGARPKTEDGQG